MPDDRNNIEKHRFSEEDSLVPHHQKAHYPPAYGYYAEAADEGVWFYVKEIWRRIHKHKLLIFFLSLIITTVVTLEAFRSKSIYRATTTVEIERPNRTVYRTGDVTIESGETEYPFQTEMAMKTNLRFLMSRPVLEDVVASLKLDENPRFLDVTGRKSMAQSFQTVFSKLKSTSAGSAPTAGAQSESFEPPEPVVRSDAERARLASLVGVLASRIEATPIEETRMFSLSVTHTDPALAAQIANATAEVFLDRSHRSRNTNFTTTSGWLKEQTDKLKSKVEEAELALSQFANSTNMFQSADAKENLTVEKLSNMYGLALKAETEKILKGSLYEEVKAGRVDQLPESYADPKTAQLRSKLDELSLQATQYAGRFGPENPRVVDLNKQVAAVQKQLTESKSSLEGRLKADYDRAVREEATLKGAFEKARSEAVSQNSALITYGMMKQKVELERGIYQDFLRKSTQAELQKQEQENTGRVIDPAFVPTVPVGPDRLRTILIGLLASLGLGVAISLLIEYLDNSVKTVEDVARFAGLPTLAMIPSVGRKPKAKDISGRTPVLLHQSQGSEKGTGQLPARIVRKLRGDNAVSGASLAEAYRGLRTSILLSAAGHAPRTIVFSSSQPAEGKTTTCINTAISLAQLGASVLIIDADMRRPSTHKAFKVSHLPGLSSYLSQGVELEGLLKELSVPNLSLLTSGPIPPNPAELISSSRMRQLLQEATASFDHVLIDSPPLMSVSDGLVLSTIAEGVILVVQAGRSSRGHIRRARLELDRVGSKIFGVVLNNVDIKREGYGGYDYYQNYTSYESDDETERANSIGD